MWYFSPPEDSTVVMPQDELPAGAPAEETAKVTPLIDSKKAPGSRTVALTIGSEYWLP
jgi:multidrug efflux pump subunit AcrB